MSRPYMSFRGLAAGDILRRRDLRVCRLSHGVATVICLNFLAFLRRHCDWGGRAEAGEQDALMPEVRSDWDTTGLGVLSQSLLKSDIRGVLFARICLAAS